MAGGREFRRRRAKRIRSSGNESRRPASPLVRCALRVSGRDSIGFFSARGAVFAMRDFAGRR
ncbi:hypothetical protein EZV77_15785 [Burkholderia thailandensis]|nr:hypothetical protein A8H31_21135 [Burkholderia thailandensis]AVR24082.1 hypothetical protein A8H32_02125 [Burkholderia thailandensis]MDD1482769.1 hypothetical protein [Burkholderia thailandensis]MDD1488789.1 hypothetical protein [Burkholderia thailandensis]MDD1495033.1 hypothetical protein [Burkholderia thailandensis]